MGFRRHFLETSPAAYAHGPYRRSRPGPGRSADAGPLPQSPGRSAHHGRVRRRRAGCCHSGAFRGRGGGLCRRRHAGDGRLRGGPSHQPAHHGRRRPGAQRRYAAAGGRDAGFCPERPQFRPAIYRRRRKPETVLQLDGRQLRRRPLPRPGPDGRCAGVGLRPGVR